MDNSVNLEVIDAKVQEMVTKELCPVFEQMETISRVFERKNHGYKHSSYLCYIAAVCFSQPKRHVPFIFPAGCGKTFIALILANAHILAGKGVYIIVPDGIAQH